MHPLQWYVIRTKPPVNPNRTTTLVKDGEDQFARRFVVELVLEKHGFEVFLPTRKVWRRRSKYTNEKRLVAYPLLVGWAFVGWPEDEDRLAELFRVPLVHAIAAIDGQPYRVPAHVIAGLFERWDRTHAPDRQRFMRTHYEFDIGDSVQVVGGPFEGLPVRVIDLRGATARVLLKLLGCEREIDIDTQLLEAA